MFHPVLEAPATLGDAASIGRTPAPVFVQSADLAPESSDVWEAALQSIARLCASAAGASLVLISIEGARRAWLWGSLVEADAAAIDRLQADVLTSRGVLTVADAASQARFGHWPELAGAPHLNALAAAPLFDRAGGAVGMLCLARPQQAFSEPECRLVAEFGALIVAQCALQQAARRGRLNGQFPSRRPFIERISAVGAHADPAGRVATQPICVAIEMAAAGYSRDCTRALGAVPFEAVILKAAAIFSAALPPDCALYHVGATTFALLVEGEDAADWQAIVHRLVAAMRSPEALKAFPFLLQAGIGVVPVRGTSDETGDLLRIASIAAETARGTAAGWALHDPAVDAAHRRAYRLLSDLHPALHVSGSREFSLHYQPRVDLRTGAYVGAEALLRWLHPELGTISPAEFIPLAERSSLARPLTEWVMEHALTQLACWQHDGLRLNLAVNISAANLDEPDFAERTLARIQHHGVLPELLTFEFTETALLSDAACGLRQLHALAETGITLAIDDFGTGYGNLSFLQRVPASVLKLDRSFISQLPGSERDCAIVRNTIAMAHELGYRVVAEGVEDAPVGALLAQWGCDEAQGYWFGRPVPSAALLALLQDAGA